MAFCAARCGNEAFFKLFVDEVVLPFVKDIQASIKTATTKVWAEDVHQEKVFMSCDGEES